MAGAYFTDSDGEWHEDLGYGIILDISIFTSAVDKYV